MDAKYTITIFVDDEEKYTFPLTPEEVISILGMKILDAEEDEVEEEVERVPKAKKERAKEKKQRCCKTCGKPGHRSNTCPSGEKINIEGDERPASKTGKLTEDQFQDVKESQEHDMSIKDIAHNLGVSVREVNRATQASSYDAYLGVN